MGIIWYVLLLTVTIVGLNIIIDYKRYGRKIFDCFKKKNNEVKMNGLISNILKNELNNKVLIYERNDNYFIAVTKFDVFLIQLMNESLNISGSIDDEYLKIQKKGTKEMKNPLPQFIKDIKLLLASDVVIKPIILKTNKDCSLNLKNFDKRNILTLQDFSYMLYKFQHSTFKYSDSELEDVMIKIKGLLDGNN